MLICIQIPPERIDEMATKNKVQCGLSNMYTSLLVKTPFKDYMKEFYNQFDSRERIETIISILEEEIDFEAFVSSGVILEHFPLHKRYTQRRSMIKAFRENRIRLMLNFISGNFEKYFQGINFIKGYYGEKFALQFAFLIHYQAWLYIISFFGLLITIYQIYEYS